MERTGGTGMPTWMWVLFGLAALLAIIALWAALSTGPAEVATVPTPAGPAGDQTAEQGGLNLDQVLQDTGLPREFTYGGLTWRATGVGRYDAAGRDLIAIGPQIGGNELYYEQGTPTNPYRTLYLRGNKSGYEDVYVMYEPADESANS